MLSLYPYNMQCEIEGQRLVLRRNGQIIAARQINEGEDLEQAIDSLIGQHAGAIPWLGKLSFCLDSSQVHYFTVPWQPGITGPEEFSSYAATLATSQRIGKAGSAFRAAFISADYASTALAAAIDEQLWQTLVHIARKWKLRVGGIQVELHKQLGKWRRRMPDDVLFCLRGAQSSIFASRQNGQWHQVWCLNNEGEMDDSLHLARIARLMGIDSRVPHYFLNNNDHPKG